IERVQKVGRPVPGSHVIRSIASARRDGSPYHQTFHHHWITRTVHIVEASYHPHHLEPEQRADLLQLVRHVADPDRTMMRRALGVPAVDELPRAAGKTVAAVGVADFEDRSGHRLGLGAQQAEFAGLAFY